MLSEIERSQLLKASHQRVQLARNINSFLCKSPKGTKLLFLPFFQVILKNELDTQKKISKALKNGFECAESQKLHFVQKSRFRRKVQSCKNKNIPFNIKFEDVKWPEYCPILDIKINYFNDTMTDDSPSFDKMHPDVGYIKENVQIVSWRANRIKNNGTAEEHRKIADYIDDLGKFIYN